MSVGRTVAVLGAHGSGAEIVRHIVALLDETHPGSSAPDAPDRPDLTSRPLSADVARINDDILHAMGGSWREPPGADRELAANPALEALLRRAEPAITDESGRLAPSVFEDPRTCLTLPFWRRLLPITHVIVCIRSPLAALRRLGESHGLCAEEVGELWLAYTRALLRHTRGDRRLLLPYAGLAGEGLASLRRLAAFVGLPERAESPAFRRGAEACVRNGLGSSRESTRDLAEEARLSLPCRCLYLALCAPGSAELEAGGASDPGQHALDELAELTASVEGELRRLRLTLASEEKGRLRAMADLAQVEQERNALESELRDRAEAELDLILERERLREDLARTSADLAAITLSRSYPLLLSIWGLHHALAPPGSRRWKWIERNLRNRAR